MTGKEDLCPPHLAPAGNRCHKIGTGHLRVRHLDGQQAGVGEIDAIVLVEVGGGVVEPFVALRRLVVEREIAARAAG